MPLNDVGQISGWGLIAVIPYLATGFLHLFGVIGSNMSTAQTLMALPMGLQEMVMAVWLIAKGLNPSAVPARGRPMKLAT